MNGSKTIRIVSPKTVDYNCIAWAAGCDSQWWEPDPMSQYYWPEGAPRTYTIDAYIEAYKTIGYEISLSEKFELGLQKVALYSKNNIPTHAARQLDENVWTSKLGEGYDVEHEFVRIWQDETHPATGELFGLAAYGELDTVLYRVNVAE